MKKYLTENPALVWIICIIYYLTLFVVGALLNNAFVMFGIPLLTFLLTLTILKDEN